MQVNSAGYRQQTVRFGFAQFPHLTSSSGSVRPVSPGSSRFGSTVLPVPGTRFVDGSVARQFGSAGFPRFHPVRFNRFLTVLPVLGALFVDDFSGSWTGGYSLCHVRIY